nr:cupin domain-containing protein [bacterium]
MVYTATQWEKEIRTNMRGGQGDAVIEHITRQGLPRNVRLMAKLTLGPGCSIGEHRHDGEAETFFILSGSALASDDGRQVELHAGDTLICQDGAHAIANNGQGDLTFFAMITVDKA